MRENFLKYKLHELFIIILQTKVKDGKKGAKIIKNPFDIVQLTLQLFAPLTKQMEVANFIFPFLLFSYFLFLHPPPPKRRESSEGNDYIESGCQDEGIETISKAILRVKDDDVK